MAAAHVHVEKSEGFLLPRPYEARGLVGWLTTVDHKRIGILYGVTAFFWMLVGGLEAILIRTQLAVPRDPGHNLIPPEVFNQLFTMHGTTMVFLVLMPFSAAFFNLCVPLMIGARDVAFPRLNAFSYWMFLAGGLFLNSSWFLGGAPNGGWTGYANLVSKQFNPGHGIDFWILGLVFLAVASLVASLNFITTILNMRAPGMTMMRLPVFVWMTLVTQFLLILAFPAVTIALIELAFDRNVGTVFFEPRAGALPVLWQHFFWIFGHPEVYILILPPMGIISEVLPTFSRKPLFGYPVVVFSGVAIGFMGFMVWSHHMFTVGLGPVANSAFALTTMAIAVPTGVKIFNWIGTLWGGQVRYRTPLLFAVGFIAMFMIGGFSGLTHSSPPHDQQQHDTYYVVAHFHYTLIGGALFGLFAGIYYWFPKMFGRMLGETVGKWVFWLFFTGFNLTFFPMHFLGLEGMPRRIASYSADTGWGALNMVCTVGAYIMALAVMIFTVDAVRALRSKQPAPADPWDGRTLEWSLPSPPPEHNFDRIPVVHTRDAWWAHKYPRSAHRQGPALEYAREEEGGIHLPGGSWFPLLAAGGFLIWAYGILYGGPQGPWAVPRSWPDAPLEVLNLVVQVVSHWPVAVAGFALAMFFIYCWSFEPIGGKHIHLEEGSHPGPPAKAAPEAPEKPEQSRPPTEGETK